MKRIYSLLILITIFLGCEPPIDQKLKIKNESLRTIVILPSFDSILKTPSSVEYYYCYESILPDSQRNMTCRGGWDLLVSHSYNKKLDLYVFDVDTFRAYWNMDTIIARKWYRKKLSFSKEELDSQGWIVTYKE